MDINEIRRKRLEAMEKAGSPYSVVQPENKISGLSPLASVPAAGVPDADNVSDGVTPACSTSTALEASVPDAGVSDSNFVPDRATPACSSSTELQGVGLSSMLQVTGGNVNMVCLKAEDLFGFLQRLQGSGMKTNSAFKKPAETPPQPKTSPDPDVLVMDSKLQTSGSRSPSPALSWLFEETPAPVVKNISTGRSPSPRLSFMDSPPKKSSAALSKASSSKAHSPSPDWSSSRKDARSKGRSPSPSWSFMDSPPKKSSASFSKASTSKACSPSWSFMDCPPKKSGSLSNTSTSKARSSSPNWSWRFSASKQSAPKGSGKRSRSRSLSPEFTKLSRKRCAESSDSDYSPPKPVSKPAPKAPPKKRGRPPKAKKQTSATPSNELKCPVCKELATAPLVVTKCGHFFHEKCLEDWLNTPGQKMRPKDEKVCPSCGMDFDPEKVGPIFLGL